MPVKVFRNRKFSTTHENKIFDLLINKLKNIWEKSNELIVVLGNFYCNASELDSLIIKRDSISVVDFKDWGGYITFSQNSYWKADNVRIMADSNKINPFLQIQHNKFELLKYLKDKPIVNEGNVINLGHISGITLFHKPIKFDYSSVPEKIASWFYVTDIENVAILLDEITSREINLNNYEIEKICQLFELSEYSPENSKIVINEDEFENKKGLIDELFILSDIYEGLNIAVNEVNVVVDRHKQFIDVFPPNSQSKKQLNYNFENYIKNFEEKQSKLTLTLKTRLKEQIDLIYNLNTHNGYVLNEFIKNKDLKEYLSSRIEVKGLINKVLKRHKIEKPTDIICLSVLEAYRLIFFERGVYDEIPMENISKELKKKKKLINNLHAIYLICKFWFADDMIKHGLEQDINEKEHIYARGFSFKWKKNIEKKLNKGKRLAAKTEKIKYLNGNIYKEKTIVEVELPEIVKSLFKQIIANLEAILTERELKVILDFFNLSWIKNSSILLSDFVVINLKNHLIFSFEKDFDFLSNKVRENELYPNQSIYEPIYLTLLEEVGIKYSENFSNFQDYEDSYKGLGDNLCQKIDVIINSWELYKSQNWYYNYNVYASSNWLRIDDIRSSTNVPSELNISSRQLNSFLFKIRNNKLYGIFKQSGCGDRYYIQALKQFKRLGKKEKTVDYNNEKAISSVTKSEKNEIKQKQDISNDYVIIGYNDIKDYIEIVLLSYKNPEKVKEFDLKKTAGIILYGPPGCGKTYWANWISKQLQLPFEEISRSQIGSSYVDGAMKELDIKLNEIEEKAPITIFFDEFDSIGKARDVGSSSSGEENRKVVNTLLQRIPKLINKGIVILAATNFINDLDSAIIRPGRFDLHIPVFPPLPIERSMILLHNLTNNSPSAILEILSNNSANVIDFWNNYTELMYLFSNSHVLDFCNELKVFLFKSSTSIELNEILLTEDLLLELINKVKSKIRKKDVELYVKFYEESTNLADIFIERMARLKYEIDSFIGKGEKKVRPIIGYKTKK